MNSVFFWNLEILRVSKDIHKKDFEFSAYIYL